MNTLNTEDIDRWTERALALVAVLATVAGIGAEHFPHAALVLLLVLTLALVITAVWSEMARSGSSDHPDYSDSDSHLADVVHEQERQA